MQKKVLVVLFTMLFILGITTSAYAAYSGTPQPSTFGAQPYSDPLLTGDSSDNNIGNANDTGNGTGAGTTNQTGADATKVIKSVNMTNMDGTSGHTQRTHGSYQNNTNSCASCHQTHTAAAGDLLFKQGVYATCTACHDGTLGFYNVFSDRNMVDGTTIPSAGTFGGADGTNPSVHLSDGTLTQSLAPGGNLGSPDADDRGTWSEKFDCASCHSPHGSYSDRLLHYNPNGMGAVPIADGGLKIVGALVYDSVPAFADGPDFAIVKDTAGNLGITTESGATNVMVVYAKGSTAYTRDTTPWLYGSAGHGTPSWTLFKTTSGAVYSGTGIDIIFGKSYAKETIPGTFATIGSGDISRAYVVKFRGSVVKSGVTINGMYQLRLPDNSLAFFGDIPIEAVNPDIYDEKGFGVPIGKYCGACHTDYRAASGSPSGMYTVAYRHTTDNDNYNCLKCHFAHGTDVDVMKDAKDNTVASLTGAIGASAAKAYMLDKNPSSALKRYTNMAVCWKCHTSSKSTQLKNNDYFWNEHTEPGSPDVPEGPTNW